MNTDNHFEKLLGVLQQFDGYFAEWLSDRCSFKQLQSEYDNGSIAAIYRINVMENILVYIASNKFVYRYSNDFQEIVLSFDEIRLFAEMAGYEITERRD